ncbi:hypothetical protein KY366_00975 [Candidatus Woesearchaeota archaeon]|nr:hypothetical protein [Candidatus Woesearchaeota archaeon]
MGNIKHISRAVILFVFIAGMLSQTASAFPVPPSQFYGDIVIEGIYADIGTNISAYDASGVLCGHFTLESKGKYIISCKGDNPATMEDEGAREKENVSFYVNGKKTLAEAGWHEGGFARIDIIIRKGNEATEELELPSRKEVDGGLYMSFILFLIIIVFLSMRLVKET